MALRTLPEKFEAMISQQAAPQFAGLLAALRDTQPSVGRRWNTLKCTPPQSRRAVSWWQPGEWLDAPRQFTFDPLMHQGLYYVQDPSSMFIGHAVSYVVDEFFGREHPLRCLDVCAAPGGKTTCIAEALPPQSLVVANELNASRAAVLAEVVAKHGSAAVAVTCCDGAELGRRLPGEFDIVCVDAPCSGEGMMRKEPVAVTQWTPALVEECAAMQRRILQGAWEALKPGGVLIYSTCTFNTLEDEAQLAWAVEALGAIPLDIPADSAWGIAGPVVGSIPCKRFIPGLVEGEGLFVGALRKAVDAASASPAGKSRKRKDHRKNDRKDDPAARRMMAQAAEWIAADRDMTLSFDAKNLTVEASPARHAEFIERLREVTDPLAATLTVGRMKGKNLIPTQQLALSLAIAQDAFPQAEVDLPTALGYLRRESLTLDEAVPRGIVLLHYKGNPLGFVNNLGNRANNLYPQSWRILSTHATDGLTADGPQLSNP